MFGIGIYVVKIHEMLYIINHVSLVCNRKDEIGGPFFESILLSAMISIDLPMQEEDVGHA